MLNEYILVMLLKILWSSEQMENFAFLALQPALLERSSSLILPGA